MRPIVTKDFLRLNLFLYLLLIYTDLSPVLSSSTDLPINKTNIGLDSLSEKTCLLVDFEATIAIKPFNETFSGHTFQEITPSASKSQITRCDYSESIPVTHVYKFNANATGRQMSLSLGIDIHSDMSIIVDMKYFEVLCSEPIDCLLRYCRSKDVDVLAANNCLRTTESHVLGRITTGYSRQCSHNWKSTLKDVVYVNEVPVFRSTIDLQFHFYRVDYTNATDAYSPVQYCLLDWILDTNVIIIVSAVVCLLFVLIVFKCLIDCRRDRNWNRRQLPRKLSEPLQDMKTGEQEESDDDRRGL